MITVLMGAPGAGKTTWLKLHAEGTEHIYDTHAVRINRDIDRATFMNQARLKAIKAAENGQNLICDGTHTIATHRLVWLNLAKRLNQPCRLVIFDTPLNQLLIAQRKREYPAPDNVVIDHFRRMQNAKIMAQREPWDFIETIKRTPAKEIAGAS
jgi:predicted kinase